MGGCRDVNKTRDEASKLVLLSNSEMDQLILDGLRNDLRKIGLN